MKASALFKEYIWLVKTIQEAGKISLQEINEKWVQTDMSGGLEYNRATFNRHKDAIQDIFGIYIECERKGGYKYYIGNGRVLRDNSVQNWMLNTLSVSNVISESMSLQDRIVLEPVSTGNDYLNLVLQAMSKSVRIAILYKRYGYDEPRKLNFEPYCLKMWHQRWYILGHFYRAATETTPESDYFGVFSFDRILSLELTDIHFTMDPDFSAEEYFSECLGVTQGDGTEAEEVILRAYGVERFYLQDLPLHHSQQMIFECEDYADFRYFIRPTLDLMGQILSRGAQMKVIKPDWFADEVYAKVVDTALNYEEEGR